MSSIIFRHDARNHSPRKAAMAAILAVVVLLGTFRPESAPAATQPTREAATPSIDSVVARASGLGQPILLLVIESGLSRADDRARALFQSVMAKTKNDRVIPVMLDISISRNRAEATRYHITETPQLLCLSPRGLIVSRDPTPITRKLLLARVEQTAVQSRDLDAKLASLEAAAANRNDAAARLELADFLLSRQNDREAIPPLESVARSESVAAATRIRAWVEMARAHLWIAEPEKGRHEAENLIATLGPQTADARAGGNLVLGIQDANGKHVALARQEFENAIAAAPTSIYAKQAAEALARLGAEKNE